MNVRELADDPPRQLLLSDERGFATHLTIAFGIEQLEQQETFVLQRCRAARYVEPAAKVCFHVAARVVSCACARQRLRRLRAVNVYPFKKPKI